MDNGTNGKQLLTQSGYKKLQSELEHLRVVRRKEVAAKIKDARAQGDLSENAEYDAAKEEQREIEARIAEIESIFKNCEVVAETTDDGKVNIGCRVTLLDVEFGEEMVYDLVGPSEANIMKGSISNESPVGNAIMGREVGDVVKVDTPDGDVEYKILKVEHSSADR